MSEDILQEINCPNCLNPVDLRNHGQYIICDACNSHFVLRGHLCPVCNTYHADTAAFCHNCGEALTRVCRRCSTSNWSGDEYCSGCGSALDIFELLAMQDEAVRQERMAERQQRIRILRAQEEAASQKRMAELNAIEEERQQQVRRQQELRRRQEQKVMLMAGAGLVLFLLVLLIFTLITA